ncbi:hypothetical protein, partial [Nocardiopsis tropica]
RDDEDESLYWKEIIDGLHRDWHKRLFLWATPGQATGHSVMWDMRMSARGGRERNMRFTEEAMEVARLVDEEEGAPFTWDGHAGLRMHAHNAKRKPNQFGFTLGKVTRDSSKLVDLAVCTVGVRLGRRLVMNHPKFRKRSTGARKGKAVILR